MLNENKQKNQIVKNKRLGYLIKRERIEQNISVRALAEYSGITAQFLSDIEHGKKVPAEYSLAKIEKALDIKIDINYETFNELNDICNKMYQAYAKFNIKEVKKYFEILKNKEHIYLYSYGFIEYWLSILIYYVYLEDDNLETYKIIDNLNSAVHLLDGDHLLKFYDVSAYYFIDKRDIYSAKKYFDKAINIMKDKNSFENAMLYTHLSIYYQISNQLWDGLLCCEKSIEQFVGLHVFERVIMNQGNKAINYSLMGDYDKSKRIFYSLLDNENIDRESRYQIYGNLANCYKREKDYENALKYSLKSLELGSDFSGTYVNVIYLYWKLNNIEKCKDSIEKFSSRINMKEKDKLIISIFKEYLEDNRADVYKKIDLLLKQPNDAFFSFSKLQFFIEIAIDIYKEYKDYEKVISLYELKERKSRGKLELHF